MPNPQISLFPTGYCELCGCEVEEVVTCSECTLEWVRKINEDG